MDGLSPLERIQRKVAPLFARPLRFLPLCFFAGGLSALSMAPANASWILALTLPVLYLALHFCRSKKTAFAAGWLFGFGYFVFGLYWVGNALLVEGNPYKWAWPLAVCGLPALLAFFPAFGALAVYLAGRLERFAGWAAFAAILTLSEWLRGHLFTGFPWNLFGYTWSDTLPVLQVLAFGDVYVLTFLTILWMSVPGLLLLAPQKSGQAAMVAVLLSFAACYSFGLWRLEALPLSYQESAGVRIIQPNIDQAEKWQREAMDGHFRKQLNLSASLPEEAGEDESAGGEKATYIIWPETAMSYRYINDPLAMAELRQILGTYPGPAYLFTGLLSFNPRERSYQNALVTIGQDGEVRHSYAKHHLVPFGEYIPFQEWIPIQTITAFSGFEKGPGPQSFEMPEGLRYSPLVCYEIIFPGRSVPAGGPPADFIVNVTNDAWYGLSPGPYQHFVQAQFRAVETGIPVVRSANTGFSGILAPNGEKIGVSTLFTESAESLPLPRPYPPAPVPPAMRSGIFLILLLLLSIAGRLPGRRKAP